MKNQLYLFAILLIFLSNCNPPVTELDSNPTRKEQERPYSLSFERYTSSELKFERVNPFFFQFILSEVSGLGYEGDPLRDPAILSKLNIFKKDPVGPYPGGFRLAESFPELHIAHYLRHSIDGFVENTTFRDPTSPIKVGDTYHIWYTKTWGTPPVGQAEGTQASYQDSKGKWKRIYSWDMASIWHATSKDGYHWTEKGLAIEPGPTGSYDDRNVFTPDVLVDNGKYYLYYQVASSPHVFKVGPHKIAMAWAESPEGPWQKSAEPILEPSDKGYDSHKVHDPCLIKKGGKIWLYFKGDGDHENRYQFGKRFDIGWGVATADNPEGPFVRSPLNPVVTGGHEVFIFPYKSGVGAIVRQGPELFTLQYAEDGLNFAVKSHLMNVPHAGAFYREGHFRDIDEYPAKWPSWGLAHDYRLGIKEAHIIRFDLRSRLE